jgi:hypothetical protein
MTAEMDLDIIELLRDEHEDLRALFREVLSAEPLARVEPFRHLVSRLAAHETAEQELVHSVCRQEVPGGEEQAEVAREQETSIERMLADMEDLEPRTEEFLDALDRLQRKVLDHVTHEEHREFPLIEEHLPVDRRRELGSAFQVLREGAPTRPHPMSAQNPTVRSLTGPVVGVFDRARHTARDLLNR